MGIALVLLAVAGPAESASPTTTASEWQAASRQLAAPWPRIQRGNGSLPDVLNETTRSRYGNGMAGLGILQTGIRENRRRLVRTGLRALNAETRRLFDGTAIQQFRILAVAEAYSLVTRHLAHWPSARAAARRWAAWLRRQRIWWLRQRRYQNKVLVEAAAVLALLRTGLRSDIEGTALGSGRREARARAFRLINRRLPAMASRQGFLLSDPVGGPPAYHALSYGMYARAVRLLGRGASRRARAVLRRLAHTTGLMTAPTGDLAYWGRSQAAKWTLSSAAYGLAVTAREPGSPRGDQVSYALAERLLRRLRSYGAGPRGEWIVPAVRQDLAAGRRSLDHYAHAPEYTGLSLVYLNWAIPLLPRSAAGQIPADRPLRALLGRGEARFAVVRRANLWYAVRERGTGGFRYDFGPVAAKRLEAGAWRDVLPLRPPAHGSAGPVLRLGSRHGSAVGTSMRVTRSGRVLIRGGFRWAGRWLRRDVRFTVAPIGCGLALLASARPGDRFNFTALFRGTAPERGDAHARSGDQGVAFSERLSSARFRRGQPTVSDAVLTRGRFSLIAQRDSVGMLIC